MITRSRFRSFPEGDINALLRTNDVPPGSSR